MPKSRDLVIYVWTTLTLAHALGVEIWIAEDKVMHTCTMLTLAMISFFALLQIHSSQMTPLHIASHNNLVELAKVLLKAGAKLDIKDCNGKVPPTIIS